jgi:DNA primase
VCPFHDDARPSLRVNVETGGYRCMACGTKGGDVLAFHRARYGLSFMQAARDLGAWR